MYTVGIFFEGKGWTEWRVDSYDAAYAAYEAAKSLAAAVGADNAAIWDTMTSDVLLSMDSEEEPDSDWGFNEDEGFDPYEGCYTFDC